MSLFPNLRQKSEKDLAIWLCVGLVIATIAAFWPSVRCDYVSWDDSDFIAFNPHVQAGLSWIGVKGAFTDFVASNWHPVTMLSYNVGWQLWGFDPAFDHLFNVLLHALNVAILFLLCRKLTGALWRSALVAALFALHPMRVESVTWIAERKDLLCALFWFLTIWVYADWVKRRTRWRYCLVLFVFALALMSKPMAVTLPFVLLLLDFWPLNRIDGKAKSLSLWKLAFEKLRMFATSAVLCVVTYVVQKNTGSVANVEHWPFALRISNGLMAYWRYIAKLIWPTKLAPLYLPSAHWSLIIVAAAAALLILLSVAILKRAPQSYLCTGWFWFLGTLVPVIGIIQVGSQSMADRYTYLPSVGLYIIVAWAAVEFTRSTVEKTALVLASFVAVGALAYDAHKQIRFWRTSETLFKRMVEIHPNNPVAHNGLGTYYVSEGRNKEAIDEFKRALEIVPSFVDAHNNLGVELARLQRDDEAIAHFHAALEVNPNFEMAHSNLAKTLQKEGKLDEAISHYLRAVEIAPNRFINVNELGVCYFKAGRLNDAATMFTKAIAIAPRAPTTYANLGKTFFALGRFDEASGEYGKAVDLDPRDADAQFHYGLLLAIRNQPAEAERHLREAVRLKPNFADAETALAKLHEQTSPAH